MQEVEKWRRGEERRRKNEIDTESIREGLPPHESVTNILAKQQRE